MGDDDAIAVDLTRRERDVLVALCRPATGTDVFIEPASVREIAGELVVTDAAVKQHLSNLYEKFSIPEDAPRRRVALARAALRRGAVSLPELQAASRRAAAGGDPIQAGREAFAGRDWETTYTLLAAQDALEPLPAEDLARLAEACWWSNRHEQAFEARRRAHQAYLAADDTPRAAHMALLMTIHHANRMDLAIANGWLAKAERLLTDAPECFAHGHHQVVGALFSEAGGDWPAVLEHGRRAREIGERCRDVDLQALGLAFEGLALTHHGEVTQGTRLLDEAMASAVAGELSTMATGVIYCRMLCSSLDLHDIGRASEWTDVIDRCAARPGLGGLPGDCRTHRAEVLLAQGAWTDGEHEALLALDETERLELAHVGIAARALGDIRLRLGDSDGAEVAFSRAQTYGTSPEPGASLLLLERGDAASASHGLQGALLAVGDDRLARLHLLPATVRAALAADDLPAAQAAVAELEQTAELYERPAITAAAEHARGTLELAQDDPAEAARRLRSALRLWQGVGAPYDAGLARTLLAQALLVQGDRRNCRRELEEARDAFERLGARRDLERVGERLAAVPAV